MDLKNKLLAILVIFCIFVSAGAVCAAVNEPGTAGSQYYANQVGSYSGGVCQGMNGLSGSQFNNTNVTNSTNGTNITGNDTVARAIIPPDYAHMGHAAGEPINNTQTNTTVKNATVLGNAHANTTVGNAAGSSNVHKNTTVGNVTGSSNVHKNTTVGNAAGSDNAHTKTLEPSKDIHANTNKTAEPKNVGAKNTSSSMPATGNPILILFAALVVLGGVGIIRRK